MSSLLTGRRAATLGVIVAAAGLGALIQVTDVLDRAELATVDARFQLDSPPHRLQDVAVVAIDEHSEQALGLSWPFPRAVDAQMLDQLTRYGVKAIAYDVPFTERTAPVDPTDARDVALAKREDASLVGAIRRARHVVLSATSFGRNGTHRVLGGSGLAERAGALIADGRVETDAAGEPHRVAQRPVDAPPLAVAVARAAGADIPASEFDDDGAWVDYHGATCVEPPYTSCAIPTYSFSDVLLGLTPRAALKGKIAVVGVTDAALGGEQETPRSPDRSVPTPDVHADQIEAALDRFPLEDSTGLLIALTILVGAALPALGGLRFALWGSLAGGGLALGVIVALAELAFLGDVVVPIVPPVVAALASTAGAGLIVLRTRSVRQRRERATLARFAAPSAVEQLMGREDAEGGLPSRTYEATVLCCRLRGFTALAGRLDAAQSIAVLDRYLAVVVAAVEVQGGTILSAQGDDVLAVFGAPLAQTDHRERALVAADALGGAGGGGIAALNAWLAESLAGADPLVLGVGLNSGEVSGGVVGPERRREYAAVGDAAEVAVYLQSVTREPGAPRCVLSATTRQGVSAAWDARLSPLGRLSMPQHVPVAAWALRPAADGGRPA